ncbi:NAD-dependent succinate-semialdehyde dehydrogenase [Reichenbachiella ulvae]|uniref:NAD-dependent succinate-semialdehyde dehydrogenase n=1 Tax=Reichenbachiella ulvae TaxID=2980104 RepID=A0ABT3CUE3_9BACT|nr:NAD-dependent succinate-semialdehyde dehydrogenase [Reichenbachiella ulvae]MCV9387257.1 NAD-dependent succinate-semialdehyde dehydrogenase [Reichenbachiella ulvae]
MKSINPSNLEVIQEFDEMSESQVDQIIDQVHHTWQSWKLTSFDHRAKLLIQLAAALRKNKDRYAKTITAEMGKVLSESEAEIEKCAVTCEYYAENGEKFLATEHISTEASVSRVAYEPLGIVLGIMPWNFPFWQAFRYIIPSMMAGNTCLLKHASNVSQCALDIEEVMLEAGFPVDSFRTLLIPGKKMDRVIENPKVAAVTLTGSTEAGRAVASKAGEQLKKTVLELGGSDPYVILEDADLDLAVSTCLKSRLINNGQSCIAAKRFIVVESIYEDFKRTFMEAMKQKTYGDPLSEVDLGPMASTALRDELHEQVLSSINEGAYCLLGGKIPKEKGAFYPPTILVNLHPGMPAFDEELFGPVASIISAKDEEEAIDLANQSCFGLGAAIFTRDVKRGEAIAQTKLQAGSCFVNELVHSDPRLPFGGIKDSGYGRELGSFGIKEFVNTKTVFVK